MWRSVPQTPEYATLTNTSRGWEITGVGTCTSASFLSRDANCTAFMLLIINLYQQLIVKVSNVGIIILKKCFGLGNQ